MARQTARVDQHKPQGGWHVIEWTCEFLGTMILVFVGLSAVVFDFAAGSPVVSLISSQSARLLLTGLIFSGTGSLIAISPIGRGSGAHLNPSVTLGFWCLHHLRFGDVTGYVAGQCLGGIAGAALLRVSWGKRAASVRFGLTMPGRGLSSWEAVGVEALMTSWLVFTIFSFVSSSRTIHWTPFAVWLVVAILVWQGAPYTGTSLNPARSLGPALIGRRWSTYWIYVVGPLGGALVAALIWKLVPRTTLTAKLFHDSRYKNVLGSSLPARR